MSRWLWLPLGLCCLLWPSRPSWAQWSESCQFWYTECHQDATADLALCKDNCDSQYPPGPNRTSCYNGCTGTYNVQETACQTARSQCLTSRTNYCKFSWCAQYCGSNNPVLQQYTRYDDPPFKCVCVCSCDPNTRPYCPGSAACENGQWQCDTPIVIDVLRNGYDLTSAVDGVPFDLACTGVPQNLAWTELGGDDGWLVLDRDENGFIDNGRELFGNLTPQPMPPQDEHRNGFLALAVFDRGAQGGNEDGYIDRHDAIYTELRVWQDVDHDGISDAGELKSLEQADIGRIELRYRVRSRVDEHGNAFYYSTRAFDLKGVYRGRVWDVFLTITP